MQPSAAQGRWSQTQAAQLEGVSLCVLPHCLRTDALIYLSV
jgi:hypothetical protein